MADEITWLFVIILSLLILGVVMPVINTSFGTGPVIKNDTDIQDSVNDFDSSHSTLTMGRVLWSMISMLFWSFGEVPFWLDITIIMALRLVAVLIVIKDFIIPVIPDWL